MALSRTGSQVPVVMAALVVTGLLAGCARAPESGHAPNRKPVQAPQAAHDQPNSSRPDLTAAISSHYNHTLRTDIARERQRRLALMAAPRREHGPLSPWRRAFLAQKRQVSTLERTQPPLPAIRSDRNASRHTTVRKRLQTPWRHARRTLFLAAPHEPPAQGGNETSTVALDGRNAAAFDLELVAVALTGARPDIRPSRTTLTLAGHCDAPVEFRTRRTRGQALPRHQFSGLVASAGADATPAILRLPPAVSTCALTVRRPGGTATRTLILTRKTTGGFADIDVAVAACALPSADNLPPPARAFFDAGTPLAGCVEKPSAIDGLRRPIDGFEAKAEALLGHPLPKGFVAAQNPFAPLDMTAAPQLDAILVSSLMMKSDFSGQVLGRLLAHHADRGTPVRILVAAPQTRPKDRAFLEALAARHPNIAVDIYRWHPPGGAGIVDRLSVFHRVHHVKALITLGPRERDNVVIMGGRNIHDGYLFREPTDLARWRGLNQYRKGYGSLNPFVHFSDFEIRLTGRRLARSLAAEVTLIWNRDADTFLVRRPAIITRSGRRIRPSEIASSTWIRQILSVPYIDGGRLKELYVRLIDSARHRIDIVTPYLNPPPAIEEAMERAAGRGVKIRILTRIDLEGDLAGEILSQVNKRFINRHFRNMAIHESREPQTILHAKLMVIDDVLSVAGSVNLNRRSFLHDTENALLILGKGEAHGLRAIIDRMDRQTRPVAHRRPVPTIWRTLLAIPVVDKLF